MTSYGAYLRGPGVLNVQGRRFMTTKSSDQYGRLEFKCQQSHEIWPDLHFEILIEFLLHSTPWLLPSVQAWLYIHAKFGRTQSGSH